MKQDGGIGKLRQEQRRYKIALQASQESIFEYDVSEDKLIDYSNFPEPDGQPLIWDKFLQMLKSSGHCDEKQLEQLEDFMYGKRQSAEIGIREFQGDMKVSRWYSFNGRALYEGGELVRVIGRVCDITQMKENEERLLEESYNDGLTRAYTPGRGLFLLEEFFRRKRDNNYALVYLDIVNMNAINTAYCMSFGDAVIKFTADEIRNNIKQEDILIRIGGCQFLVLCKHTNKAETEKLAKKFLEIPHVIYTGEIKDVREKLAILVLEGFEWEGFPDLPKLLEQMQEITSRWNGEGVFYLEPEQVKYLDGNTPIFREYRKYQGVTSSYCKIKRDLLSYAFELLEKTRHLPSAIQMLLHLVGKCAGLRYIHVYEVECHYLVKKLQYQWIRDEKYDCKRKVVRYAREGDIIRALDIFNKNGVFAQSGGEERTADIAPEISEFIGIKDGDSDKKIYANQTVSEGKILNIFVFVSDSDGKWSEEETRFYNSFTQLLIIYMEKQRSDSANKAKTEFLSRMSHEIRTPINGIVGMIEILKSYIAQKSEGMPRIPLDDKIDDCLNKVDVSISFLTAIINDILEMSKIESGKLKLEEEPFTVDELAGDLEDMFTVQTQTQELEFLVIRGYEKVRVMGDSMRLKQVMVNLISNAVKFTPKGGKVKIALIQTEKTETDISYRFSVEDTGCGIREEDQSVIFQSFMQANANKSRNHGGTGLGLSISQNIVTMMGGRLSLESVPGKGSEFYFALTLPIVPETGELINTVKAAERYRNNFAGKRILLAEDNELNAEITETLLKMRGFEVDIAQDGSIAVNKFKSAPAGYYDAVIMDIRMPNMDGLAATREIRISGHEDARTIPIVAMTSDAFDEDVKRAVSCGMNGYLAKPVNADKIMEVLGNVIFAEKI